MDQETVDEMNRQNAAQQQNASFVQQIRIQHAKDQEQRSSKRSSDQQREALMQFILQSDEQMRRQNEQMRLFNEQMQMFDEQVQQQQFMDQQITQQAIQANQAAQRARPSFETNAGFPPPEF